MCSGYAGDTVDRIEDVLTDARVEQFIDRIPERCPLTISQSKLLFGFSREAVTGCFLPDGDRDSWALGSPFLWRRILLFSTARLRT